jgi:AcrR family transcriptional regulator
MRDSLDTRRRLVDAARARFRASAYEGVTLRDIALDAGVDASLVNRYFGGKAGLYRAVLQSLGPGRDLIARPADTFGTAGVWRAGGIKSGLRRRMR